MSDTTKTLARAAGMGMVAGMRSMAAPAFLSHYISKTEEASRGPAGRMLGSRSGGIVLALLASGEMLADKTPWVPERTEAPSLVGRALSGALCGAVIAEEGDGPRFGGALLGASAALCASYVALVLRQKAGEGLGIPDVGIALVEDALACSIGARIASSIT